MIYNGYETKDGTIVPAPMTEPDTVISHYGVKGMRWGVRKGDGLSHLSNAQLQKKITRLNLEQSYARLSASQSQSSPVAKGKQYIGEVLKNSGKQAIQGYANAEANKIVKTHAPKVQAAVVTVARKVLIAKTNNDLASDFFKKAVR